MATANADTDKISPTTNETQIIRDTTPPENSSDGEGSEKTTREKLKKTSIAGLQQHSKTAAGGVVGDHPLAESITVDQVETPQENGGTRGRPSKKRSFEYLQQDDQGGPLENGSADLKRGHHKRMRSREVEHSEQPKDVARTEAMGSPLDEESDDDAHSAPGGPGILVDANSQTDTNAQSLKQTEQKMLEEQGTTNEDTTKAGTEYIATTGASVQLSATHSQQPPQLISSTIPSTSGFANVSSASPFGAVKSPPRSSQEPQDALKDTQATSSSAFASSGLSAFASSEKSPFGASGTTSSSGGFGGASKSGFGGSTSTGFGGPVASGFGSTTGFGSSIGFGGKPVSGFGGNTSFASATGFGGGAAPKPFGQSISSFASPSGAAPAFGKAKTFGVKSDDEEEDAENGEDGDGAEAADDTKPDSRFHQQEVETGEEGEELFFQARARLYHFDKEWKERGTGNIKINIRYEQKPVAEKTENGDDEEDPEADAWHSEIRKARVVMRADGVHRVILNSPVFKGMKVGTNEGKPPIGKTMYLTGLEDGQPRLFQIKIGKEDVLRELYEKIEELKEDLE